MELFFLNKYKAKPTQATTIGSHGSVTSTINKANQALATAGFKSKSLEFNDLKTKLVPKNSDKQPSFAPKRYSKFSRGKANSTPISSYRKPDFTIDVSRITPDQLVQEVRKKLEFDTAVLSDTEVKSSVCISQQFV